MPTPARATLAHPDRSRRYATIQRALWALRLGAVLGVLALLYLAHLIEL